MKQTWNKTRFARSCLFAFLFFFCFALLYAIFNYSFYGGIHVTPWNVLATFLRDVSYPRMSPIVLLRSPARPWSAPVIEFSVGYLLEQTAFSLKTSGWGRNTSVIKPRNCYTVCATWFRMLLARAIWASDNSNRDGQSIWNRDFGLMVLNSDRFALLIG